MPTIANETSKKIFLISRKFCKNQETKKIQINKKGLLYQIKRKIN
jgi:hypothetical protein